MLNPSISFLSSKNSTDGAFEEESGWGVKLTIQIHLLNRLGASRAPIPLPPPHTHTYIYIYIYHGVVFNEADFHHKSSISLKLGKL